MSKPGVKISVIIPNYNHAKYLQRRIESVLNQTYTDFEVIILDDCSTDNSQFIVDSYRSHPRISHIVINTSNTGSPFKQWEKGITLAAGEWIWIAESDDYADSRFLEVMLAAVANRPSVGLAYCDSRIVDKDVVLAETFASIKNNKMETSRWGQDYINEGLSEIEDYLLSNGTINNTSAVLFRKKVLVESNPFDISLRYTGDKYAFIKVLARSNVAYVSEALNYFRNPYNTKSSNQVVSYFYEQFLIFDWVSKNLPLKSKMKFFEGFHTNTRCSLFRDWGRTKVSLYVKLFYLNPSLLFNNLAYNFREGLRSVFRVQREVTKKSDHDNS